MKVHLAVDGWSQPASAVQPVSTRPRLEVHCARAYGSRERGTSAGSAIRAARDNWNVKLRVECYSGSKTDERPVRFHLGERLCIVDEVLDQWYGPGHSFFKVRADDGNLYILRQDLSTAERAWSLESFREFKE